MVVSAYIDQENTLYAWAVIAPVNWVSWSAHGKSKWTGLICIGWQGIKWGLVAASVRILHMNFECAVETKLAPCGWPCPHKIPTWMVPFGNMVISLIDGVESGSFVYWIRPSSKLRLHAPAAEWKHLLL